MNWQEEALKALEEGRTVQVRPRGHSMTGRIGDGDLVILKPCATEELIVGAIVLVRIQGKRFSHIVLHSILSVGGNRYHIGSHQGRIDGWVDRDYIYGIVTAGEGHP
jgi:hypothetical protein